MNNEETTFRSPTPGPDFSTIHRDSITLDELIDRLTPTSSSTPEVNEDGENFLIKIIVYILDYISLSCPTLLSNTY